MHFSSGINRPPYEAESAYLQVTSGCSTHNQCAFCAFYKDSNFKASPIEEIKEDLAELRSMNVKAKRIFLQGADPFVLSYDKLMIIAELIHEYLPTVESIGGYARINNMTNKSVSELRALSEAGYSNPYFGIESGDDVILDKMNKGYTSELITEQCSKMDAAGFRYIANFLNGLGGHNYGMKHAHDSARILNGLKPTMIYASSLTLMPGTPLYKQAQTGEFQEATEVEKLQEMMEFIKSLTIQTIFEAVHVSIAVPLVGTIPNDKDKMIATLQHVIDNTPENNLRNFRESIKSL
ncbi:radical SAM protein [Clostridium sp. SHJSY1]|uniref:radical SAM protein n=1 Tax=Clostridium sp. SHJSY1 TaxID=2942483 RepID=UPI002874BBAB|nr:radical SAM protein [Clostridium sp. SHJSY1]MDS0524297.1 radical SAM protein [Clostridium sp. SHJSY1]